jgi:hypothetical protein
MPDLSPSLLLQGFGALRLCPPVPALSLGIDSGVAIDAVDAISRASKNSHIFFTDPKPEFDIIDCQLKWGVDLTAPFHAP